MSYSNRRWLVVGTKLSKSMDMVGEKNDRENLELIAGTKLGEKIADRLAGLGVDQK